MLLQLALLLLQSGSGRPAGEDVALDQLFLLWAVGETLLVREKKD